MITKRDEQREGRRAMSGGRSPALVVRTPGDVVLEERDAPVPGPGEVLIRPDVVGLCGTDLDLVAGELDPAYTRYPLVLGHEWSGTVVSADGAGLAPGTRVVAEGIVPCGHCARCRAGDTNLCATYDELGFTRDGAAAGYVAVAAARRGGSFVLIGLPPHGETAAVPVDDLVNNDLTIRGSFGYTSSAWRDVVGLLNSGRLRLDFLVTHRFGLADWEQALGALRGSESPRGKVMLTIGSPEALLTLTPPPRPTPEVSS